MQKYCIYKHTCKINKKSYIGQTCQKPSKRWETGGKGYEDQPVFWAAIQKYGWDNFDHEILEEGLQTVSEANAREKYWISYYNTYVNDPNSQGYNVTRGGDGGDSARCDYVREKLRAKAAKRKVICIETGEEFATIQKAIITYGQSVRAVLDGKCETAYGYHWCFKSEQEGK